MVLCCFQDSVLGCDMALVAHYHLLNPSQPSSEQVMGQDHKWSSSGFVDGHLQDMLRWRQRHQLWEKSQLSLNTTFPDVASVVLFYLV